MWVRLKFAVKAAGLHLLGSVLVAVLVAALVLGVWYPGTFRDMAGGAGLFALLVSVDVVCGPLLTCVLWSPHKPRAELGRDVALVLVVQLAALCYGVWTMWVARPLYVVLEVDRFRVIAAPDIQLADLQTLPPTLQPRLWEGPRLVGIRPPLNEQERMQVMADSLVGGRDYAQRPAFYLPYNDGVRAQALQRSKPLSAFVQRYPGQAPYAARIASAHAAQVADYRYVPVMARGDWVAVMDARGEVHGYLQGDGF
ncbi:MAG: pilus assembly protein [Rhodoferax sp.]|nr:pilus assembly protein [Rhodoferax sp.]